MLYLHSHVLNDSVTHYLFNISSHMIQYLIRLKQPSGPIIMLLSNNLVPMILVPLFKDFISPT